MPFPFKIGDKVVYTHAFSEDDRRMWLCEPVVRIEGDFVHAFCPNVERVINPVMAFHFVLQTRLITLLYRMRGVELDTP